MSNPNNLRQDEQEFYDHVMYGSAAMLPNTNTKVTMYGLETPTAVAHGLRKMGVARLDMSNGMTSKMELRYMTDESSFCINAMAFKLTGNESVILRRTNDSYSLRSSASDRKNSTPYVTNVPHADVDLMAMDYELPLRPSTEDPEEYRQWLNRNLDRADSWRIEEKASLRPQRTVQNFTARLIAVRDEELFPNSEFHSLRGVEYTIDDRSNKDIATHHLAFVGEIDTPQSRSMESYTQTKDTYRSSGQSSPSVRKEVLLTPYNRSIWERRLLDETTGIPYSPDDSELD